MDKKSLLKELPKVDKLLKNDVISELCDKYGRVKVKNIIIEIINEYRKQILDGKIEVQLDEILIIKQLKTKLENNLYSLKRVVNATGTILHTNLGRSILSDKVIKQLINVATNYSNLEFDLESGQRGSRYSHVVELLKTITGAEDAIVVNNNAAAVLLVLSTLCKDKEVLVSRGELVEIGGAFRIPEVICQSGGELKEVGTTNKTHLKDYKQAIDENTGAILKVHTSNYRIIGFSESVSMQELSVLAKANNLPLINDLGSGSLIDMSKFSLPYEPTVQHAVKEGCDVVTFSGDKLLGGPQAGIIVGKKEYIDEMKHNQLLRALRIDKMTLAALEVTLQLYLDEEVAIKEIPVLNMLSKKSDECLESAKILLEKLNNLKHNNLKFSIAQDQSAVGGGSYPQHLLDTYVVAINSDKYSAQEIQEKFRSYKVPVITRIKNNQNFLDLRTIKLNDFDDIINACIQLF